MSNNLKITGRIMDVFAHRFVVETLEGVRMLADVGPKALDEIRLKVGLDVVAEGAAKRSEVKISRIALTGGDFVDVDHGKPYRDHWFDNDKQADLADASVAVGKAGLAVIGEPRRKPQHFEVLTRRGEAFVECHVAFDGTLRKEKPVKLGDAKWSDEMRSAA